jgi:hypothetical protein
MAQPTARSPCYVGGMKMMLLVTLALAAVVACKDKPKDTPAVAPSPTQDTTGGYPPPKPPPPGQGSDSMKPTTPTPGAAPTIALQDGESFEGGDVTSNAGTNPYAWKATATDTIAVAIVFKGETGRVVMSPVAGATQELGKFEFNSAYSGSYAYVIQPDGSLAVMFSSSGGSGDPGFTAAWKIKWDVAKKAATVVDKGEWEGTSDKIPAWANLPDTE